MTKTIGIIGCGDIACIIYNGSGRPHEVFLKDSRGFDFYYKNGWIQCNWSSGGFRPYISQINRNRKRKINLWFDKDYRPCNASGLDQKPLSDKEIKDLGYTIVDAPKYTDEIIEAIMSC